MDWVLTRTGEAPAAPAPRHATGAVRSVHGPLLAVVAHAATLRLSSPQRELTPEWFRFPLP